jgi:peptidoglycan/LPS O-acetylase OafA/YrhL
MTQAAAHKTGALDAERSFFFDVVRGVSAQLVVVGHAMNVCFPSFFMVDPGNGVLEARKGLFYLQNLGVLVFFCISGYLITSSVLRKSALPSYDVRAFLLDRFARIFTPLVPLLLLLFVVENILFSNGQALRYTVLHIDPATLLLNLGMLFDHPLMSAISRLTGVAALKVGAFGTAGQLWTVVIEWWIYVSFGLLALAFLRRERLGRGRIVAFTFAFVVPGYALALGNGLIVAWLAGMGFRLAQPAIARLPANAHWTLAGLSFMMTAATLKLNAYNFYSGVAALLFATGLFMLFHALPGAPLTAARALSLRGLLKGLSEISYSVYLVHLSVILWLMALKPQLEGNTGGLLTLVAASNATAIAFYFAFERHYPAVRRRLGPPARATTPPA